MRARSISATSAAASRNACSCSSWPAPSCPPASSACSRGAARRASSSAPRASSCTATARARAWPLSRLLVADGLLRALGDASAQFLIAAPGDPGRGRCPGARSSGSRRSRCRAGRSRRASGEGSRRGGACCACCPGSARAADPCARPGASRSSGRGGARCPPTCGPSTDDADSALTVVDASGALVFSSLSAAAARAVAEAAARACGEGPRAGRRGGPDRRAVAALPREPLRRAHWYVIRSQSRAATFAPLSEFRDIFRWSILLAAARRDGALVDPDPAHAAAGPAARGAARGSARAAGRHAPAIEARDEFGELGRAFDGMASRIERHVQALASASAYGVALSEERSEVRLVALVLQALVDVTSSAGAILLRPLEGGTLQKIGRWARGRAARAARGGRAAREPVLRAATPMRPPALAFPLLDREQPALVGARGRAARSTSTARRSRASASRRSRRRARSPRRRRSRCAIGSWSTSSVRSSRA